MKKVRIVIDKDGTFEAEAVGFNHQGCRNTLDSLVQVINGVPTEEEDRASSDGDMNQFLNL